MLEALMLVSAFALNADDADIEFSISKPPCVAATAWLNEHKDQLPAAAELRDMARALSAPQLRENLHQRFLADQHLRRQHLLDPTSLTILRDIGDMDRANVLWLRTLVEETGVPSAAQVGERGLEWMWVLVQHADLDPQLQETLIPAFIKRYEAGELPADYIAKLTDRVLLNQNRKQRFGTQFDWLASRFILKAHVSVAEININRQRLGLMPLADYACFMQAKLSATATGSDPFSINDSPGRDPK